MHIPLTNLRTALLHFHKALLEAAKENYIKTVAPISGPGHFLQLLTSDAYFAWLRPVSMHIVTIDEAMEAKTTPLTEEAAQALIGQAAQIVAAMENDEASAAHFREALAVSPAAVLAHERVLAKLG